MLDKLKALSTPQSSALSPSSSSFSRSAFIEIIGWNGARPSRYLYVIGLAGFALATLLLLGDKKKDEDG